MGTLRIDKRLQRWCNISLGGRMRAVTVDVSAFGFCAELGPVFLPGSSVDGTIQVRDRAFRFEGEVTWAHPGSPFASRPSRIGVRFTRIPEEFGLWLHQPMSAAN
jgi:hypothetical protein